MLIGVVPAGVEFAVIFSGGAGSGVYLFLVVVVVVSGPLV